MLPDQPPKVPSYSRGCPSRVAPGSKPWASLVVLGLGLGLTTAACSGDKGGDSGDVGVDDRDADGFAEADDCNDGDDTIFPGAEDTWYDGVDSDCGGDDDFDADLDGYRSSEYGGLDCDDGDAAVFPEATETWYDGVDSDCAEDDDYDADRDGFSTNTDGPDFDCDDTRSDIYPGAIEVWYDGADGDCDGLDDFDADLDGFRSALQASDGDDCDDTDAAIRPDATEIWYDGIDQDCDEADDFDADGDGEAAQGEIATGTDCNDDDPTIFSGATERLDGLDSDCDGQDDDFTTDQDVQGSWVVGAVEDDAIGGIVATGHRDNDGFVDLAIVQAADDGITSGGFGMVLLVDGTELTASPLIGSEATTGISVLLTQTATGPVSSVVLLGEFGDPSASLQHRALTGTPEFTSAGEVIGAAWVTPSALPGSTLLSTSAWRLLGEADGSGFGQVVMADSDLDSDGDGMRDIVVSAPDHDGGTVYLFQSSSFTGTSGDVVASDADVIFTGASASGALGTSLAAGDFAPGDDADDDGDAWLIIGDPLLSSGQGSVYVVENDFSSWVSGPIDSRYISRVTGAAGSNLGTAVAAGDTLDETSDVREELVIGAARAITRAGQVQYYGGEDIGGGGTFTSTNSYLQYTGSAIDGFAGTTLVSGQDVSGDGLDDVLIGGPGNNPGGTGSGAAWLVVSNPDRSRGQSLLNASATISGASPGDGVGYGLALGDFDADGKADVVFGAPGDDFFGDEGLVRVYTSAYPTAEAAAE